MASFTVAIFSASSSGISMSNASSKAITSSTMSSESAPRSSTKEAVLSTWFSSTPSCSTMICFTFCSTDDMNPPQVLNQLCCANALILACKNRFTTCSGARPVFYWNHENGSPAGRRGDGRAFSNCLYKQLDIHSGGHAQNAAGGYCSGGNAGPGQPSGRGPSAPNSSGGKILTNRATIHLPRDFAAARPSSPFHAKSKRRRDNGPDGRSGIQPARDQFLLCIH